MNKMISKIKTWWFGTIPPHDAKEIYLRIPVKINEIIKNLEEGRCNTELSRKMFNDLKINNHIELLPFKTRDKLKYLFEVSLLQKLPRSKERSDKSLHTIFSIYPQFTETQYRINDLYSILLRLPSSIPTFREFLGVPNPSEFDEIIRTIRTDADIQQFIHLLKRTITEGYELNKQITLAYQTDVLKPEKRRLFLEISTIILSAILLIATINNLSLSNELIEKQLTALAPRDPTIRIYPPGRENAIFYAAWRLAEPVHFFEDGTIKDWNREEMDLIVQNIGELSAGAVNFDFSENDQFYIGGGPFIPDLRGSDVQSTSIKLWYKGCSPNNTPNSCRKELVKLGINYINVTITCKYCKEEIKERIRICIYNQTENECEKIWYTAG